MMTKTIKVEGPVHVVCHCDKCKAQPQRTWVGLTYEEESELIRLAHNHAGIRFYIQAAEAKLKEKNNG